MAIGSCTSGSSNLASLYAEQIAESRRSIRPQNEQADSNKAENGNNIQAVDNIGQNGPTVNGLGETVGLLINTTA